MLLLCVPEQVSRTTLQSSSITTRDTRSNNNHKSLQIPAERRANATSSDSQATNETPSRLQDWKKYHIKLNRWILIKAGQASAWEGQRDIVSMFHCYEVQAATWSRIRIFEQFQLILISDSLLSIFKVHWSQPSDAILWLFIYTSYARFFKVSLRCNQQLHGLVLKITQNNS